MDLAAAPLGITDLYKSIKGLVTGSGETARPHAWQRAMGLTVTDPRVNALSEIHNARSDFMASIGKDRPESYGTSRIANMRNAATYGNRAAFRDALDTYLLQGGNVTSFRAALDRLDPIKTQLNQAEELRFTTKFLTGPQRQKLDVARRYAHELESTLVLWWGEEIEGAVRRTQARRTVQGMNTGG
jgi:hypothetical protein